VTALKFLLVCFGVILAGLGFAYVQYGMNGFIGMAYGLSASAFNLIALWLAVRHFSSMMADKQSPVWQTTGIVAAFFAKIPLFYIAGTFAQRHGSAANTCFMLGMLLVYSVLVGRVLTSS
jgi:hypothetical protein